MAVVGSVQILLDVNTAKMSSFSAAANRVAADTARMRGAMRGVGNEASNSFIKAGQAAVAFNGHLGGMGNRLRSIGLLIGSLDTAAVAAGAGFATAAAGLNLFITRADRMKRAENDLRTITTSASNLADVQKELFNISQRARAPMEGTIMLYARTARALESFGTSQKDVLRITETVQKAFAVGGATPAEAMGAAIQLSQGIASNRFSGEEYRSVSENAPVLLRAMADQLGVNIGKLREMAYAGKLTGDVVAKAILGASDAIDKQFGKTVSTVGQSIARISNSFDQYTYETDKALGITNKLAAAGNFLADNFNVAGDSLLTLSTLLGSLALGRLGSVLVGTKNQETGKFGGIQGQIRYGLFHATRERAQAEKEAALKEFDSYKKQIAEIDRQIKAMESNGGLDQKGADRVINERLNQTNAIAATRARVISADEKINKLAADRIALTGKIKTAQAAVVEGLRAEQVEAQRIVKSQRMQLINAGRRFRNSGRLADFEREVKEVERLQKAQEDYAKSTERLKAAQGGVFDSAALRKYGSEINEINRQLVSNQKAQARASADLLKAQENYVAAQRLSPAIQEKTRGELARSAQVLDGLKERQVELNSLYTEAARRIDIAGRRISFVGAAMDRLKGFGRGLLGVVGGAPGLALTGAITGFALIATHIAKANQETEEWKQSLRDAGYLVDDVAEGASKIDEAIETKNLSALRLELQKTNEQLNKVRDGGFLADLGFTNPGIKQISDEVSNQIAKLQLIQESFTRRGAAAPQFLKNDQADFLRFNEIINGAKESGEVTNELNDELQALANKHNELDPLLETFRAIVKVVDAASRRADDLKKSIEDIAESQGIPGWLQDAQFQTDAAKKAEEARKSLNDLKKERLREAGLSPEDKAVEDRIDDIVKAAKKKGIAITDAYKAEVRAQAEAEIAAEKAVKEAGKLKDISLDAIAEQMGAQTAQTAGSDALAQSMGTVVKNVQMVQREFENMQKAAENARYQQLLAMSQQEQQLESLRTQYMQASTELSGLKTEKVSEVFGDGFFDQGAASAIENATSTIHKVFSALADGRLTARQAYQAIEMVRTSLQQMGGDPTKIDQFVNHVIAAELHVRSLGGQIETFARNLAAIPDKTVTLTLRYKRVGDGTAASNLVPAASNGIGAGLTGTYSGYDAGGSSVGVHRYSSPTSGFVAPYTSQEFFGSTAEAEARVKELQEHGYNASIAGARASGGPVEAGKLYRVNENGTELFRPSMNGTVLSASASQASSSPFGETEVTKSLKATEENTASTVDVLKSINGKVVSSGGFSSTLSGGSPVSTAGRTVEDSPDRRKAYQRYLSDAVMRQNQFAYQLTRNNMLPSNGGIIYGGPPKPLSYQEYLQSLSRSSSGGGSFFAGGFADGGVVMPGARKPGAGDTQRIGIVKRPEEAIAVLKPDQLRALQQAETSPRSIQIGHISFHGLKVDGDGKLSQMSRRRLQRDTLEAISRATDEIGRGQR